MEEAQILLVEDEEYDVELTLAALAKQNAAKSVHVARDGVEALDYLEECEARQVAGTGALPRLILLDLNLPRLGGIEVLKKVKSLPTTRVIPVVVLTSSSDDRDMQKAYLNGVNSYLQKPVAFNEFSKLVEELHFYWLRMNRVPTARAQQPTEETPAG